MKDELGRKIITKFFRIRAKTYSDLRDYAREYKTQNLKKRS